MDAIESLMRKLPPPPPGRSPGLAAVIGFILGGLGLAFYLWNVIDFFFPILVGITLFAILGADVGWLGGALFASVYGYFRVGVFVNDPGQPTERTGQTL